MIASTDVERLTKNVPSWLMAYLNKVPRLHSNVMTFAQMERASQNATEALEIQRQQAYESEARYERELEQLKERLDALQESASTQEERNAEAKKSREEATRKAADTTRQIKD